MEIETGFFFDLAFGCAFLYVIFKHLVKKVIAFSRYMKAEKEDFKEQWEEIEKNNRFFQI